MMKFKLYLDKSLLNKKIRDIFKSLVYVDKKCWYARAVPSNYGYVLFGLSLDWDNEALTKYYKDYISEGKFNEIEEVKKKEGDFCLSKHVDTDTLLSIALDHPDIIKGGQVGVTLALLGPELTEDNSIDEAITLLSRYIRRLETLKGFVNKVEEGQIEDVVSVECRYVKFEEYSYKKGYEIILNVVFAGEELLGEVETRIDKAISPLKKILTPMVRHTDFTYLIS